MCIDDGDTEILTSYGTNNVLKMMFINGWAYDKAEFQLPFIPRHHNETYSRQCL